MLRSSMNSALPPFGTVPLTGAGLYITSLITTGPITGPVLTAPRVALVRCQKSVRPSAPVTRPTLFSGSVALNEADSRYPPTSPAPLLPVR